MLRNVKILFFRYLYLGLGPIKFQYIGNKVVFDGSIRTAYPFSKIYIGSSTMIGRRCYFLTNSGGKIWIGENTLINDDCYITSCFGILIGKNVLIGEKVSLRDYDHRFSRTDVPINSQGIVGSSIKIGDDVWLGKGVVVTKGVTIGQGCIIGANSVVTRSIPPYSIAVGAPARVIKSRK